MPSWGEILQEFLASASENNGTPNADVIRRSYLSALAKLTRRSTISYSTAWLTKSGLEVSINLLDMQGLMEVCRGLPGPGLDIILHSPGGTAEAAASLVAYLRQKYTDIRVFVPLAAMSAATMWALAANRIVMGMHSQLGPIDPQVSMSGGAVMPARTILDQFDRAKRELAADPATLAAWAPVISQYGPGLLEVCEKAEELAKGLVEDWLREYMFSGQADAAKRAKRIATFFGNYTLHKSHSIGIFRDQAKGVGLIVDDLESDRALQDAVLSVHHATMLTFQTTLCQLNRCFGNIVKWDASEIQRRAESLLIFAQHIWPRPPAVAIQEPLQSANGPANFHAQCVAAVQAQLGVTLSKLSRTRYESGDQKTHLVCAVSTEHNEKGGTPYFWFAFHLSQLDYLESATTGLLCLGCGSPEHTLLIPVSEIKPMLKQMSLSTSDDRHYWHVVVQRKNGRLLLRFLGAIDGPDLNAFIVQRAAPAAS